MGVHSIMEWVGAAFGHRYAENTRETIRRQTLHQFEHAAIVRRNPDDPNRPVNSPHTNYQIDDAVIELLRTYDSPAWEENLRSHLEGAETLRQLYAQERERNVIEVQIAPGLIAALTAGGQNPLIKAIAEAFVPQFVQQPRILYLGDAGAKTGHFDEESLRDLGLTFDMHGQMPDLLVHDGARDWLILVEAVTSHGPMNPKRIVELRELFSDSRAGLVFVSAFPDRRTFSRYLADIAWETEVWIATNPTHMIHFNGERFLGPYGQETS